MPHGALSCQDHDPNDTARASIPLDRLLQRTPHKADALFFCHLFPPIGVGETVDVGRPRAPDGERLLV